MSCLDELDGIVQLAYELGVSSITCFHFTNYFDHLRHESLWQDKEYSIQKMAKTQALANKLNIRISLPSFDESQICKCGHPFRQFWVQWSGKVSCCPSLRFVFGDVRKQKLAEIWNSNKWITIRDNIYRNSYKELCPHCPEWQHNQDRIVMEP